MEEEREWVDAHWARREMGQRSELHSRTRRLVMLIQDVQRWAWKAGGRDTKEWWRLMIMKAKLIRKLAFSTHDNWAKKVRKAFEIAGWDWVRVLEGQHRSMVYIAFNDLNSHCYVGETGRQLKKRADEEITNAKKRETKFEKAMSRLGEECWFWLPLVSVRGGKHEVRRRQGEESTMIGEMTPDMNTARTGKGRWDRGREERKDRGRTGRGRRGGAAIGGRTMFEARAKGRAKEVVTGDNIGEVLETIGDSHREVVVTVKWGEDGGKGWKRAKTVFLGSEAKQMAGTLGKLRASRGTKCELELRGMTRHDVLKKLRVLVNHRDSWRGHLRKVSMWQLFDYWVLAGDLALQERLKVRKALRKYQRGRYSLPTNDGLTLRVHMTEAVGRREVGALAQKHIVQTANLTQAGKKFAGDSTRVIMTKGETVEGILANHYRATKGFDEVECAGPPWCDDDNHFHALMKDMVGEIGEVGRLASNAVVWDEKKDSRDDVMRGLAKYAQAIERMSPEPEETGKVKMWWREGAEQIVVQVGEKRRTIREDKLGWMWERYQRHQGTNWKEFVVWVAEEMKFTGTDCGIHRDLRNRIIREAGVQVQRSTNVWQAWVGVAQYEGVSMGRWGGREVTDRMEAKGTLVVCWQSREREKMRKQAISRWQEHGAVTIMVDVTGTESGEGVFGLGETSCAGRGVRIGVVGVEGLRDYEGLKKTVSQGLLTGERKGDTKGGGEVTLRVAMMKGWQTESVTELIAELDEQIVEELQDGKVSSATVRRVKGLMQGLVVAPLDKGGNQLAVECGVLHKERVQTMAVDSQDYLTRDESEDEILKEMKEDYEACGMTRLAPWGEECIPPTAAMPKYKAPWEKTRILNSYKYGPANQALRYVSKALTWIFGQLGEEFTGFTLMSVRDAKEKIVEGNEKILEGATAGWKLLVDQQDVVRMFTNLDKAGIRERVRGVLDEATKQRKGRGGRSCCITLLREGKKVVGVRWGSDRTNEDNLVMTFEQIMVGVEFDLAHNFCGVGKRVLEQGGGCPIGGLCSAAYANIYCAHDERAFCKRWEHAAHLFYAVRQVDDGLLVMRWDEGDEEEQDMMLEMREDARKTLYTGGPEVEVEEKVDWLGKKTRVWAGLQLRVGEQGVVCKTHNKNEESIKLHDVQKFPRYTQGYSYQGEELMVGVMQGSARRIRDQCMVDEDFVHDLTLDLWECMLIGTEWKSVAAALKRMPNLIRGTDEEWSTTREGVRKELRRRQADLTKRKTEAARSRKLFA
jgi:hypothetical protein